MGSCVGEARALVDVSDVVALLHGFRRDQLQKRGIDSEFLRI